MHEFMFFLAQHWILAGSFVLVFFALIMAESYTKSVGGKNISPEMLVQRMNHEKAVVVDLRDAEQFKQSHIINAINIPSGEFDQKIMRLNSFKQQPLVLVCGSQAMPSDLLKKLFCAGFADVRFLEGGIKGWQSAGLPLEKT
ncbi:MAG: rhodanese-like domain-containing protein [Pseudomonadota bacterium]